MQNDTLDLLSGIAINCIFPLWVLLAVSIKLLFWTKNDVAFKRVWSPRFTILIGVLFVLLSSTTKFLASGTFKSLGMLVVEVPVVALGVYLSIRFTKFCDRCGATVYRRNLFSRPRFCTKCGAELDAKPKPDGTDQSNEHRNA